VIKAKVDENQREIVDALRIAGYKVQLLHRVGEGCPDILVGVDGKWNILMEIKVEKGKLNDKQRVWHAKWSGQVSVIHSARQAVGYIRSLTAL